MNRAELRLMQRRLAQVKPPPSEPIVDQANEASSIGPYVGHKSGKRKRGVSVLKRKPRQTTQVTRYYVKDDHGNTLASTNMLTYRNPE